MDSSEFQFGLVKDRRPDGLGELRVLPDELVCAILGYLSPLDVGRLACVSRCVSLSRSLSPCNSLRQLHLILIQI